MWGHRTGVCQCGSWCAASVTRHCEHRERAGAEGIIRRQFFAKPDGTCKSPSWARNWRCSCCLKWVGHTKLETMPRMDCPGSSRHLRLIIGLLKHLVPVMRFSLETGLRWANVTGLRWSQVDLTRRMTEYTSIAPRRERPSRPPCRQKRSLCSGNWSAITGSLCLPFEKAHQRGQYKSLAGGPETCRNRKLPLARSAACLGELAWAGRDTASCLTGAGRLGVGGDIKALCSSFQRTLGEVCEQDVDNLRVVKSEAGATIQLR